MKKEDAELVLHELERHRKMLIDESKNLFILPQEVRETFTTEQNNLILKYYKKLDIKTVDKRYFVEES